MGILKSNIGGNYADNAANIVKLIDNISKENKNRNDHDSIKLIDEESKANIDKWMNRISVNLRELERNMQRCNSICNEGAFRNSGDIYDQSFAMAFDKMMADFKGIIDRVRKEPYNFVETENEEKCILNLQDNIRKYVSSVVSKWNNIEDEAMYDYLLSGYTHGNYSHGDPDLIPDQSIRKFIRGYGVLPAAAIINDVCKKMGRNMNVMISEADRIPDMVNMIQPLSSNTDIYGTFTTDKFDGFDAEYHKLFKRVAIGNAIGLMIRNKTMDIIYARSSIASPPTPEYLLQIYTGTNSRLTSDIKRYARYIRMGGILMLSVPTFQLAKYECSAIANNFELIGYYKTKEANRDVRFTTDPKFVYVTLILKRKSITEQEDINGTFEKCFYMDDAPLYEDIMDKIVNHIVEALPKNEPPYVNLFRGNIADQLFMSIILSESNLTPDVIKEKFIEHKPAPLLPFKKSQVGQVLASGKLDGIIDEGDGYAHAIRGHVSKAVRRNEEYKIVNGRESRVRTEITNNVISISMFKSDGEYKSITMTN